jgi:3'-5' exoribonuclease
MSPLIDISGKNYPTLSDIIKVPENDRNSVNYLGSPGVFIVISSSVKKSSGSGLKYSDALVSDKDSRVKVKIWGEIKNGSLLFADYEYSKDYRSFSLNPISIIDGNSRPDLLEIMIPHFEVSGYVEILDSMIENVNSTYLKQLLKIVFDKDGEIYSLFLKATAASNNHHVGIGGLLFHTISVSKLALDISSNYPEVDKDMVLTGALLHDIGKIYTYTSGPDFEYTDDGKLENHIVIGIKILTRAVDKIPDFPKYLEMVLFHVIASHHGALEFGSPVVPKIPEAMVVHFADEIDAKMRTIIDTLDVTQEGWTDKNQFLGTEFFKWRLS